MKNVGLGVGWHGDGSNLHKKSLVYLNNSDMGLFCACSFFIILIYNLLFLSLFLSVSA